MISDIAQRLNQELQRALPALQQLIPKRELQTVLQSTLAKLDLVTREEFDAQSAVLLRTRMKLEELERRCADMEKSLSPQD